MRIIPALAVLMALLTACGSAVDVNDSNFVHRQQVIVNGHDCTVFLTGSGGISVVCP